MRPLRIEVKDIGNAYKVFPTYDSNDAIIIGIEEDFIPLAQMFGMKLRHQEWQRCHIEGNHDGLSDCNTCNVTKEQFLEQAKIYLHNWSVLGKTIPDTKGIFS